VSTGPKGVESGHVDDDVDVMERLWWCWYSWYSSSGEASVVVVGGEEVKIDCGERNEVLSRGEFVDDDNSGIVNWTETTTSTTPYASAHNNSSLNISDR
jgi:hypothetical protein